MEEIKVGEYARINDDIRIICKGIGKITGIVQDTVYIKMSHNTLPISFKIEQIVNHSTKIIDLIEVGDYVNGYKVIGVTLDPAPSGKCVDIDCDKPSYESYFFENQIYSIVTKEQFESVKYEV